MFIAHLPAGYILTKKLQPRLKTKHFLWVGLLASLLPDIDMLYFYFIDHGRTLHHNYWIHIPFYWALIALTTFTLIFILKKKSYQPLAIIFFANIFLHLFLDTIVGKIGWFYPFSEQGIYFFDVPAVYNWWVYNFIFHWTFLFEIALIGWAACILIKNKKNCTTFI
jgi:inner membrane protein